MPNTLHHHKGTILDEPKIQGEKHTLKQKQTFVLLRFGIYFSDLGICK